jgi:hypothetical protein
MGETAARNVSVGAFASRTEAEMVRGLLESAGIGAWLAADDAGGAVPLSLTGGVHVMVAEADADAAREVVAGSG